MRSWFCTWFSGVDFVVQLCKTCVVKSPQQRTFDIDRFGMEATGVARVSESNENSFRMQMVRTKKLACLLIKDKLCWGICCLEKCVCNYQMRHVHVKVWPGGKRPPGPIVKAGTIYQRSPHSSLIWIVKFVSIFIAEKCSSGQQGKVFGSWVVVKFPKQKLTSCLMVGVATRRSATMFCIFKVSWLVVCFSCARAQTHALRLATLWETSRFRCWNRCIEYHWMSFFRMQGNENDNHTRDHRVWQTAGDSCMLLDMRCDVIFYYYYFFLCVCVTVCVVYV